MRRRHLRTVVKHERESYPRPWSRNMFLSELAMRGTRAYIVADMGGDIVGHAGMMMNGSTGHITTIVVGARWRRHGIASRLLAQLTAEILQRGGREATLEVRESNRAAQALYRRFGYVPVGRRRNYYAEAHEDAIIMTVSEIAGDDYRRRVRELVADLAGSTRVQSVPRW